MYQFFSPAVALAPFVACYWTLHAGGRQGLAVSERIFVDGSGDLIFNFGCPYLRRVPGQPEASRWAPRSNLDALRETPVLIDQQGEIHLTGVRFKPGGLAAFLRVPPVELRNQVIDLPCVFGPEAGELELRLFDHLEQPQKQAALLDEFLLGRLAPDPRNELAYRLAQWITGSAGRIDIGRLSREAGYSVRHLDRLYRQCFGISPKFHARIARFQGALNRLVACPGIELVELAEACGYYDQAHLSKEFAEFAGQSPNLHRAHLITKIAGPIPPNLVHFLQEN